MYSISEISQIVNSLPKVKRSRIPARKDKTLYNSIIFHFSWLKVSKVFTAAMYCIDNNIIQQPKCKCCNNFVNFCQPSKGFYTYCSVKCRANDTEWLKQSQTTFASNHEGYRTWSQTLLGRASNSITFKKAMIKRKIDNPNSFKEASQKAQKTMKERYSCNVGWLPHAIETRLKNKTMVPIQEKRAYEYYRYMCDFYTSLNDLSLLENHEKRNNHAIDPDAYHLDHIVSCLGGFNENIPPFIIGSLQNLRFIPSKTNLKKHTRNDMEPKELVDSFYRNFSSRSLESFSKLVKDKLPVSYKYFICK